MKAADTFEMVAPATKLNDITTQEAIIFIPL
jgi:hypothetical protein